MPSVRESCVGVYRGEGGETEIKNETKGERVILSRKRGKKKRKKREGAIRRKREKENEIERRNATGRRETKGRKGDSGHQQ